MFTGAQEVRVVRVEAIESLGHRRNEVKGVKGTEEHRLVQPGEELLHLLEQGLGGRNERPQAAVEVVGELPLQPVEHLARDGALAELAMEGRRYLRHRDPRGDDGTRLHGQAANCLAARLVQVELGDQRRIEIGRSERRHARLVSGRGRR